MISLEKLPAEKYDELKKVYEGFCPDPRTSVAFVARDGEEIAGRIFLLAPVHIEGPWVRDDLRGLNIGARLMQQAEKEAKRCGLTKIFAYAVNGKIESYLTRLGYQRVPMTVWEKQL